MTSPTEQPTAWQVLSRPSPLRERVYEALRAELRAGRFARGERLREEDIARQLGVSRTPVREALVQLYRDGLLSEAGRGFMLADLTTRDIAEILELRLLLEPAAARHAAEHAPEAEVLRLRHCLLHVTHRPPRQLRLRLRDYGCRSSLRGPHLPIA